MLRDAIVSLCRTGDLGITNYVVKLDSAPNVSVDEALNVRHDNNETSTDITVHPIGSDIYMLSLKSISYPHIVRMTVKIALNSDQALINVLLLLISICSELAVKLRFSGYWIMRSTLTL